MITRRKFLTLAGGAAVAVACPALAAPVREAVGVDLASEPDFTGFMRYCEMDVERVERLGRKLANDIAISTGIPRRMLTGG